MNLSRVAYTVDLPEKSIDNTTRWEIYHLKDTQSFFDF